MKSFREVLNEDFSELGREPSSYASKEAKQLGLEYYSFGRYGKKGKVTHVVVNGRLSPVQAKKAPNSEKHQKLIDHAKGLAQDKNFSQIKKENPERYKTMVSKASEKVKQALTAKNDEIKAFQAVDKANQEFEKFSKTKQDEVKQTHETLKGKYDWRGFTSNEKKAINNYTSSEYLNINNSLRSDGFIADKKTKDTIKHLDKAMEKTKAPADFVAYRGVTEFSPEIGIELQDKGYLSTSTNFDVASSRGDSIIQFKIKKGQKGIYMDGHYTENKNAGEGEFLLPRQTKFRITGSPIRTLKDDTPFLIHQAEIVQ